jgi:glc operon protein GlcG
MTCRKLFMVCGFVIAAVIPGAQAQDLATKKVLTLAVVKQLVAAAEKESCKRTCGGVIAIMDEGGILVYLERGDEAQPGGTELAIRKARTSYLYKRTTASFQDRIAKGETFLMDFPEVLPAAGGIPLFVGGKLVGAVGISGGPGGDDLMAQAVVDALAKIATP